MRLRLRIRSESRCRDCQTAWKQSAEKSRASSLPPFAVTSGLVACSSSTAAPHEFFGHMGHEPSKSNLFG
jgi:hypothetical protein